MYSRFFLSGVVAVIKRLCVFDFDGTLFRSPERPSWWPHAGWWTHPGSLNPPCVPETPGDDWWVAPTLQAAQQALADDETYTVMLTGRLGERFDGRVRALVKQTGLEFDEFHLCDSDDSIAWKTGQLRALLKAHPDVEVVEVWEDRTEQLRTFRAVVGEAGLEFRPHQVDVEPHALVCKGDEDGRPAEKSAAERVLERFLARNG
jgi:hypothetical protein